MAKTARSFETPAEKVADAAHDVEKTDVIEQIAEDNSTTETVESVELTEEATATETANMIEQTIDLAPADQAAEVVEQIAEDAASPVEVIVARAPSITREELEAMGLDPAPYGFIDENKSAD